MSNNGFSAADMSTAAANGFRDGLAAQPAAAQEAVAWRDDAGNLYPDKESVDKYLPRGRTVHALYAAPVAAAPVDLTNWAAHYSINPAAVEALQSLLARTRAAPDIVNESDFLDIPSHPDFDPPVMCESTPAAPGIDHAQFREAVVEWRKQSAATLKQLQRGLTPLGGEPVATLTIGEVGGEGATQAYFLDRIRDTEAFGKLPPGTYQLAVCSMQATSPKGGGFPWENFPAYLIDKCEGDTISEEGLQRAVADMAKDPRYALQATSAKGVRVKQNCQPPSWMFPEDEAAPADSVTDWRVKAAAWLEEQATEQENTNKAYPAHVAAYPSWADRVHWLRTLAYKVSESQATSAEVGGVSAPIDVLAVVRKVAVFNGGLIADDLRKVELVLKPLLKAGRQLSADLEHAIALANFGSPETVAADHPIRQALDEFDAAIDLVQPTSHGAGVSE